MKTYLLEFGSEDFVEKIVIVAENLVQAVGKFTERHKESGVEWKGMSFDINEIEVIQ